MPNYSLNKVIKKIRELGGCTLSVERLQLIVDSTMYLLVPELVVLLYKFAPSSALPPCAEVKILLL